MELRRGLGLMGRDVAEPGDADSGRPVTSPLRWTRPAKRPLPASRQLIRLISLLILVLLLFDQARRPENWSWFAHLTTTAIEPSAAGSNAHSATDPPHAARPSTGDTPNPLETGNARRDGLPGVTPDTLRSVRDDTYFRKDEQASWFAIWHALQSLTDDELQQRSRGERSYLQIYRQTEELRGQIVTLAGVIRKTERVTAPANDVGITEYWQTWLFPTSDRSSPIVVYSLARPPEVSSERVLTTGCVYKRWAYRAEEGLRVAPVLLAKNWQRIDTTRSISIPRSVTPATIPQVAMLTGAIAIGATFTAWLLMRRPYPVRSTHYDTTVSLTPSVPRDE